MILCLAFAHVDADLALRNAQWMANLKNHAYHEALMICNIESREKGLQVPVHEALTKVFKKVHVAFCTEDERMWPDNQRGWPWPQNLTFSSAARYVRDNLKAPWLFLEADAIPLRDGWLDEIEGEYTRADKPFMGMLVDTIGKDGNRIPAHMSGIAVYPPDLSQYHDKALQGGGTAFDMVLRDVTVTNMADTKLIHHQYQTPSFKTVEDLKAIRSGAGIFHQSKDGSLIDRLLAVRGLATLSSTSKSETASSPVYAQPQPSSAMTTDIFIKTYPKDYGWLVYCLRSIEKFATYFRKVVIVSPEHIELESPQHVPWVLKVEPDREPGYLWQQSVKLHADRYTDADQILFMDSDCIFTQPVTPHSFMRNGKFLWLKSPMDPEGESGKESWIPAMRNFAGYTPKFEYMRRHPFIFPAWFLKEVRDYCTFLHGVPLEDFIMKSESFSEFNCAGMVADAKFRDRFEWLDTSKQPEPPTLILQHWSHDPLDDEVKAKLESILKDQPGGDGASPSEFAGSRSVKKHPESPGAEEQKPALNPVSFAIATLAHEASQSPLHKARLGKKLVAAGVIAAPKRKAKA